MIKYNLKTYRITERNLILFLIFFVLSYDTSYSKNNNVCYVSSSEGNDYNDGSVLYPFRTFSRAVASGADTVFIKSGDIFYENIEIDGQVVNKYGDGPKPLLYGIKIPQKGRWENGIIVNGKWIKKKSNIWRIDLSADDRYFKGFKTGGASFLNNIGAIINIATDDLNNCRKVPEYKDLSDNYDFWQPCPVKNTGNATIHDFDFLYLFLNENPNEFDFGLSVATYAVSIKNGEVSNLNLKYWEFGIIVKDNVKISNCDIDGIGGNIQRGVKSWVLFGNGIELWVTPPKRYNCIIENCNISRTFDCGATIQGRHYKKKLRAEDIIFRNNTFRNCCQSFEEFLRGPTEDDLYYNCFFENNLSIDAGINTGFRYFDNRYKRCHFLSNSNLRNTHMIIRNNIAINGNYLCAGPYDNLYRQAIWQCNTCHIKRGQDLLGNYVGTKDVIKVPTEKGRFNSIEEATDSAISNYRYLTGDTTTHFIIIE